MDEVRVVAWDYAHDDYAHEPTVPHDIQILRFTDDELKNKQASGSEIVLSGPMYTTPLVDVLWCQGITKTDGDYRSSLQEVSHHFSGARSGHTTPTLPIINLTVAAETWPANFPATEPSVPHWSMLDAKGKEKRSLMAAWKAAEAKSDAFIYLLHEERWQADAWLHAAVPGDRPGQAPRISWRRMQFFLADQATDGFKECFGDTGNGTGKRVRIGRANGPPTLRDAALMKSIPTTFCAELFPGHPDSPETMPGLAQAFGCAGPGQADEATIDATKLEWIGQRVDFMTRALTIWTTGMIDKHARSEAEGSAAVDKYMRQAPAVVRAMTREISTELDEINSRQRVHGIVKIAEGCLERVPVAVEPLTLLEALPANSPLRTRLAPVYRDARIVARLRDRSTFMLARTDPGQAWQPPPALSQEAAPAVPAPAHPASAADRPRTPQAGEPAQRAATAATRPASPGSPTSPTSFANQLPFRSATPTHAHDVQMDASPRTSPASASTSQTSNGRPAPRGASTVVQWPAGQLTPTKPTRATGPAGSRAPIVKPFAEQQYVAAPAMQRNQSAPPTTEAFVGLPTVPHSETPPRRASYCGAEASPSSSHTIESTTPSWSASRPAPSRGILKKPASQPPPAASPPPSKTPSAIARPVRQDDLFASPHAATTARRPNGQGAGPESRSSSSSMPLFGRALPARPATSFANAAQRSATHHAPASSPSSSGRSVNGNASASSTAPAPPVLPILRWMPGTYAHPGPLLETGATTGRASPGAASASTTPDRSQTRTPDRRQADEGESPTKRQRVLERDSTA